METLGVQEAVGNEETAADLAGRRLTLFHNSPFRAAKLMGKTLSRNALHH
jgi:hypothetical protein